MTEVTITRSGWPRRPGGRARLAVVALTCSGAALIAGCTSGSPNAANKAPGGTSAAKQSPSDAASPSPGGSPTVSQAVCVHINSLRTSLTSVTHIKVSATSAGQLSKDLANIQTQLTALKGENLGSFSTQAKELTADINKIKKDAAELSTNPTVAAKSLTTDLATLKTKAGPMVVQMKKVCHVT
ncbi:MAG TPA: hypothetical protein VEV63_11325 [Streptosporangiaceae bacterium]|nr:hypothetical protein [Streptosporangiaceae bacterium]